MRSNHRIIRKQIRFVALLLFALSVIWIQPARAQSQDSRKQEIQQLKDKLDQLDQMMNDVRAEIKALEGQAQSPSIVKPVAPSPAQVKEAPAPPETMIAVPSEAMISTPKAGVVPLGGELTDRKDSVNFYGFAMLDSGYDFQQVDPNWYDIKGVALPVLGVVSFLDHTWSERFTSSVGYAFLNIQNSNAWHVGLPAKSGVGGGIVAIAPGKDAIAVFAPPLDEAGNSFKAQEVIEYVANKLNYNLYSPMSVGWK